MRPLFGAIAWPVTLLEAVACGYRDWILNPPAHCERANCDHPISAHEPSGAGLTRGSRAGVVIQTWLLKSDVRPSYRKISCVPVPPSASPQTDWPSADVVS